MSKHNRTESRDAKRLAARSGIPYQQALQLVREAFRTGGQAAVLKLIPKGDDKAPVSSVFLASHDVAARLGISPEEALRLIESGELPSVQGKGVRLVPAPALDTYQRRIRGDRRILTYDPETGESKLQYALDIGGGFLGPDGRRETLLNGWERDLSERRLQHALELYRDAATVAEIRIIAEYFGLSRETLVAVARTCGVYGPCYRDLVRPETVWDLGELLQHTAEQAASLLDDLDQYPGISEEAGDYARLISGPTNDSPLDGYEFSELAVWTKVPLRCTFLAESGNLTPGRSRYIEEDQALIRADYPKLHWGDVKRPSQEEARQALAEGRSFPIDLDEAAFDAKQQRGALADKLGISPQQLYNLASRIIPRDDQERGDEAA